MSQLAGLLTLATITLGPTPNPLLLPLLIAILHISIRRSLHSSNRVLSLAGIFLAISLGTAISWIASSASSVFPLSTSIPLVSIFALLCTLPPFLALLAANLLLKSRLNPKIALPYSDTRTEHFATSAWLDIVFPAILLAMTGKISSYAGVGRSIWWIREGGSMGWIGGWGGVVLVDFAWASMGVALGRLIESQLDDSSRGILVAADGEEETGRRRSNRLPYSIIIIFVLLLSLSPQSPAEPTHLHPSPIDAEYIYPPLKLACVTPPTPLSQHNRQKSPQGSIDEYLRETRVIASRGAKIISWAEGAVRLDVDDSKRDGEGWTGMGRSEKEFLRSVAEIADAYRVYIAASYVLPLGGSHRVWNIVTLVGPTNAGANEPYIVFSTTKQLPVPLVESYAHAFRQDPSLKSLTGRVPESTIEIAHRSHTPSPNLTPLQSLSISSATCFDISLPALFSYSPSLILNPSSSPVVGLSLSQIEQAKARAIENHAFVLRCDASSGGVSALISPDGIVLAQIFGGGGAGSWEFEIDVENASSPRFLEGMRVTNEWLALGLLSLLVAGGFVGEIALRGRRIETKGRLLDSFRAGFRRLTSWRRGATRSGESDPLISFD